MLLPPLVLGVGVCCGGSRLTSSSSRCAGAPQLSASSLSDPIVAALSRQGYGRVRGVTDVTADPSTSSSSHLRYDTDEGPVFCKRSPLPPEVFASEATSLRVMRSAALTGGYIRVPRTLGSGSLPLGGSYLLLEWIEPSQVLGLLPATQEEVLANLRIFHPLANPPRAFSPELPTCEHAAPPWRPSQLGLGLAALHSAPQPPPRRGFGFECDTHLGRWQQVTVVASCVTAV